MAIQLQSIKGFRDLYPQDKAFQNFLFEKLKAVASLYGFENYDGPILEPIELYLGKSSKELVEEQTFKIIDKKDQTLVMRPEMTPSLARMIAQKANQLIFPLKLFNLGLRFRYEAPQRGREREFYQADFDILGTENILADAEILATAVKIFLSLDATKKDFVINVNSRTFIDSKLTNFGVENKKEVMSCIDRKDKVSKEKFSESLKNAGLNDDQIKKLISFLETETKPEDDPYFKNLFNILKSYRIDQYFKINTNTVRGLDYYTGLVFEVRDLSGTINRALLGGGRYDNLVSSYNPNLKIPGVGFATSDVVLLEFIKSKNLLTQQNSKSTKYLVTVFGEESLKDSINVLNELRNKNIPAEIYPDADKKLDKQLKYADRNGIPFAIILGPEEIQKNILKIKNMKTGEQKEITLEELVIN